MGIGYLPQNVSIFRRMTVEDNLASVLEIAGVQPGQLHADVDAVMRKFHIASIAKSFGAALSGGERRRVEIARAIINRPKFLLLDEPFTGIDPLMVEDLQEVIRKLRAIENRLLSSIVAGGLARVDALGLGLEVQADGRTCSERALDGSPLFVVGPLRRGTLWESTAVAELRRQAAEVARIIAAEARAKVEAG